MSADLFRLEKFFNPRAIAVIGASEQGLYPAGVLRNLLEFGFPGPVYPVNPNQKLIFGMESFPSIEQTPGPVDLAIVVVNRSRVLQVVSQCAAAGVRAVLIITAGFAEGDAEGIQLQAKLSDLIKSTELAILGPNCAGYADLPGRLVATRLPCPSQIGGVSFISQSGALMMALYGVFIDQGLGLNKIISIGNQVDIDLGTGLAYLAHDPETHVIGAFVEGVKDGALLVTAMQAALQNGKPLVLVKSGRTVSGQKAASTHTAAVAGSDFVFQSVCTQFGVHLAADIREMVDVLRVQAAFGERLINFKRWMIVTQSGGMGSFAADVIENAGIQLVPPGTALKQALQKLPELSMITHWENPADVRGASLRGSATQKTLRPFLEDTENDLVVLLLARSLVQLADEETARAICEVVRETDKPLVVVWVGQHISVDQPARTSVDQLLTQAGILVFPQVSDAVQALSAARKYWVFRQLAMQNAEIPWGQT